MDTLGIVGGHKGLAVSFLYPFQQVQQNQVKQDQQTLTKTSLECKQSALLVIFQTEYCKLLH